MNFKKTLAPLLLSVASIALFAGGATAGTQAGLTVTNTVDLSYVSGADTITRTNAASADFMVDRKVDFVIVGQAVGDTVVADQGAANQEMIYQVVNEGNDISGYDFDISVSGSLGLIYDATGAGAEGTYSVYTSPNATGGPDTLYDINGTVNAGDIAKDGVFYLRIIAHIPTTAVDGDADSFVVTATALDGGTNTPTVENRGNGLLAEDTILADTGNNGVESDGEFFVVQAPDLTALKTVAILSEDIDGTFDCTNGTAEPGAEVYVPGACLEYTVSISNAGTNAAETLSITDDLPTDVTFVAIKDIVGFDTVTHTTGTIDADTTSLPSGNTASFKVRVTVN